MLLASYFYGDIYMPIILIFFEDCILENALKVLPVTFVLIYTVAFLLLFDFSQSYESIWIIAIINIPLSSVFYSIIGIFHISRNIIFDIAFLYIIGCIQYSIIGYIFSKIIYILVIFIKNNK